MSERYLSSNGLTLAYQEFGNVKDPVILLIMGLGGQMIEWPESLCTDLASRGYRVIRFDNRDIGLSEKLEQTRGPAAFKMALCSILKLPIKAPYTLMDMADDTVGLLDSLAINSAHLVGLSMGGMIAQIIAGKRPERARSLTSIMSSSGRRSLPGANPDVWLHMAMRPSGSPKKSLENHAVRTLQMIGSPGYAPSKRALRSRVAKSFKRSYYPQGQRRQLAAILASGDRVSILRKITAPTLVVHGKCDPLVPVAAGVDTALQVPGAKLELIDGMGHDLPDPLLPHLADLISIHASQS
ncbi:MAG: alpha/beta hydrolase [Pseudomonadota bacterium]